MSFKIFLQKLTSRKFLAAVTGVIMGLSMVFGLDEGVVTTIAGAVTALASLISYITAEGRIDAAAAATLAQHINEAKDKLTAGEGENDAS